MGCGGSKPEDQESKARSDEIENQLRKDRMAMRCVLVLSLLRSLCTGSSARSREPFADPPLLALPPPRSPSLALQE